MIHHLNPKPRHQAIVDQGKSLFQPITYLRPAKAHLANQT
jgi:hypothetical protein